MNIVKTLLTEADNTFFGSRIKKRHDSNLHYLKIGFDKENFSNNLTLQISGYMLHTCVSSPFPQKFVADRHCAASADHRSRDAHH